MKTLEPTSSSQNRTIPYTMSLGDGRTLFIAIPVEMVEYDRSGEMCFTPDGFDHLDKIRALAIATPAKPTPGYLQAVRKALGLTQAQMAKKIHLSTISIKRWESGTLKPGVASVAKIRHLVDLATRRGVVLER
jgi:DNA-binding XRE family transcriptional regulator